jgi:enhancing lycopene biosynthesis protein 2
MKIGILLSGCGVNDGAEIQEAVLSMLAIQELGAT